MNLWWRFNEINKSSACNTTCTYSEVLKLVVVSGTDRSTSTAPGRQEPHCILVLPHRRPWTSSQPAEQGTNLSLQPQPLQFLMQPAISLRIPAAKAHGLMPRFMRLEPSRSANLSCFRTQSCHVCPGFLADLQPSLLTYTTAPDFYPEWQTTPQTTQPGPDSHSPSRLWPGLGGSRHCSETSTEAQHLTTFPEHGWLPHLLWALSSVDCITHPSFENTFFTLLRHWNLVLSHLRSPPTITSLPQPHKDATLLCPTEAFRTDLCRKRSIEREQGEERPPCL